MGKASRDKGKRVEYLVRDHLRKLGYTSHRVPSSGAAQGFKGDVTYEKGERRGVAEVKARASLFKPLYAYLDAWVHSDTVGIILDSSALALAVVGYDFETVMGYNAGYCAHPLDRSFRQAKKKLESCRQFVKDCDVLILKDDNRKLIFVRYL